MDKEKLVLVVDTNIVLSAILKDGLTRKLLLNPLLVLFSPQSLTEEVERNSEELCEKMGLDKEKFLLLFKFLFSEAKITQIYNSGYIGFHEVAKSICPIGHKQDWPFLALALKENVPLWSNDSALKSQKAVKVISTKELIELLYA